MSTSFGEDEDEITGINVTPLVDVMLVLLIIFMATTTYLTHREISVALPKAETGAAAEGEKKDGTLTFSIDKENTLSLNGEKLTYDNIEGALSKQKALHPNTPLHVTINADLTTHHGFVVKLMDQLRKNGITDFAISVETEEHPTHP